MVAVILEVDDVGRSAALYRDAFGLDLHASDHENDDRWIGGAHAAISWEAGAFLHFALYQAKAAGRTTGAQVGLTVEDIAAAHVRAITAGATLIHGPRPEPWGTTSRYYDLDGNVVSLTQAG
jgi:predicted enzyme related to lactoylglutathione lyase